MLRRRSREPTLLAGAGGCGGERRLSSLVGLASQPGCTTRRETQPEACVGGGNRDHAPTVLHCCWLERIASLAAKAQSNPGAGDGDGNITQDVIAKVLSTTAPIVIGWLASQFFGKKQALPAEPAAAPASPGGTGDLLGDLLGGGKR
ncbi:hypothetical protein GCM10007382_19980 [Salinibacterium xinjiangense]|uniref:hypothetical protein n=1 Tax=Salinibacterium xinjiangense TaxID=386302 RepID=UPI000BE46C3F|nr:hypothetical protein [Salinibacterium xinjiangense]GGL00025.1 hypothetical protein GCM10007382_19980 [Salinibacterium xinjiangense]